MPYAPQVCSTLERDRKSLLRLLPKSGDGRISGIAPGISHTLGSSWLRAFAVGLVAFWATRPHFPSAPAMIELPSEKMSRSDWTADTTLSHDGPLLPAGSLVGPVPVWKKPNSPVKQSRSRWASAVSA